MRVENTRNKYRKNRKNNKFNKILDLEKEEVKKGPELRKQFASKFLLTRSILDISGEGHEYLQSIFDNQGGRGGRFLQGNLWHSPPAIMTSRLASITFKMASKVFIEETDKNFDFITEILFRFLGFRDFKVIPWFCTAHLLLRITRWAA